MQSLDEPAGCALLTDPQAVVWAQPESAKAPPERLCRTLPQLLLPQVRPPAAPEAPHAGQVIGCLSHAQVLGASALTCRRVGTYSCEEAAAPSQGKYMSMTEGSRAHQDNIPTQDGRRKMEIGFTQGCFSHAQLLVASAHINTRSLCDDPQAHSGCPCRWSPGRSGSPPTVGADAAPGCDALPGSDMCDAAGGPALLRAALSCPCRTVSPPLQHLLQPAPQSCCPVAVCQLPAVHLQAATAKFLRGLMQQFPVSHLHVLSGNLRDQHYFAGCRNAGSWSRQMRQVGHNRDCLWGQTWTVAHHLLPDGAAAPVMMCNSSLSLTPRTSVCSRLRCAGGSLDEGLLQYIAGKSSSLMLQLVPVCSWLRGQPAAAILPIPHSTAESCMCLTHCCGRSPCAADRSGSCPAADGCTPHRTPAAWLHVQQLLLGGPLHS